MTTHLPAFDAAALDDLRALDDDDGFVLEIVTLFRAETPGRVDAIRDAFRRRDAQAMRHEAHALKSSSAQLGARRLSDLCRRIEGLGREDRADDAAPLVAELSAAAREADEALARAVRAPG